MNYSPEQQQKVDRALASLTTAEADLRQAHNQLASIRDRYKALYEEGMTFYEAGNMVRYESLHTRMLEEYAKLERFSKIVESRKELVEKLQEVYDTAKQLPHETATAMLESKAREEAHNQAKRLYPNNTRMQSILEKKLYTKILSRLRTKRGNL